MSHPEFWIVAGPNGAGKTTCVQREPISLLLPHVTFLNPDDHTLGKLRALGYAGFGDAPDDVQNRLFIESADEVFAKIETAIDQRDAIGVETVLSSEKYLAPARSVIGARGFVGLIYIALSSPSIAKERVAARVKRGGHGVPADKIEQRWKRSLANLRWFLQNVTAFWVYDNSDSNPADPPRLLARGNAGVLADLDETAFPEMRTALSVLPRA